MLLETTSSINNNQIIDIAQNELYLYEDVFMGNKQVNGTEINTFTTIMI